MLIPAEVAEWQTRYFEGVVGVFSCGFKSHSPHHVALDPLGFNVVFLLVGFCEGWFQMWECGKLVVVRVHRI